MKKIILVLTILFALGGCGLITPKQVPLEQQIVEKTQYVIRIPPKELMTLPIAVSSIDVDKSTQSDVAAWMLQKEQYTRTLENMLKDIAGFFNTQQAQLDQAAKTQNIQLQEIAVTAQSQEQVDANKKTIDLNARPAK